MLMVIYAEFTLVTRQDGTKSAPAGALYNWCFIVPLLDILNLLAHLLNQHLQLNRRSSDVCINGL